MTAAVVQSKTAQHLDGGHSSETATFDSPPTEGNTLVIQISTSGGGASAVALAPSVDWTIVASGESSSNAVTVMVKVAGAGESSTITVALFAARNATNLVISEVSGVYAGEAHAGTGGAGAFTATIPAVTPDADDEALLMAAIANSNSYAISVQPAGYTLAHDLDNLNRLATWTQHVASASGGSYSGTVTYVDGSVFGMVQVWFTPLGPRGVVDVYKPVPPGDTLEFIGTITEAEKKSIRPVRNDPGSGQFTINRYSAEATAEMIAPGNVVKIHIPEIDDGYIFAFFMDDGDFTLVSTDEQGGETVTIGGDGILSYLNRAVWRNYKYSVDWWPVDMADPPDGAEGLLRVPAGKHRFYNVNIVLGIPLTIVAGGLGLGYSYPSVAEFDAYIHDLRMYRWPFVNGKGTSHIELGHIMSGQPHAGEFVSPFDDTVPIEFILPGWSQGTEPIKLIDVGDSPGAVLYRMIQEAQHPDRPAQPIPLLTIDFDATTDSNGDAWTTTDALAGLTAVPGEDYLTTLANLVDTGVLDVEMDPDFGLHAYNSQGRDLTGTSFGSGVVRFAKGVNIADQLRREIIDRRVATHAEVQSNVNGGYQRAETELADAADRVTRELGVIADATEIEHEMRAVGDAALAATLLKSDALIFATVPGDDEDNGIYLPGPEGTDHGKYWLGDTVTVDTGSGVADFAETSLRVAAVTITEDEAGNLIVQPELASQVGQRDRDLFAGDSHQASGGAGYAPRPVLGTPASPEAIDYGDAALADHLADTIDAHDASAISFVPTGTIAATDVQAAIAEVASEAALTVKDEGSALATTATILDFVGAGVVATGAGATKTITIAAGGTSASDTALWRPVMDGAGAVLTDGATGEAIMAYGAA